MKQFSIIIIIIVVVVVVIVIVVVVVVIIIIILGMPKHVAVSPVSLQPIPSGPEDVNSTVLALRTLGSFDFQGKRHDEVNETSDVLIHVDDG